MPAAGATGSWSTETSVGTALGDVAALALVLPDGGSVGATAAAGELAGAGLEAATGGGSADVVSAGCGAFARVHQTASPEPARMATITLTIPTAIPLPERAGGVAAGVATGARARVSTPGRLPSRGGGAGVRMIAARYEGALPSVARIAGSLAAGAPRSAPTTGVLTSGIDAARSRPGLVRAPLWADSPGGAIGWSRSLYLPRPSAALTASSMAFCLRSRSVRAA